MIAKLIRYPNLAREPKSSSSQDDAALLASLALGRYILDLELNKGDRSLVHEIGNIGRYVHDDQSDNLRICDKAFFGLGSGEPDDQVREFAYRVAGADPGSLRHLIVAYGEDQADEEMARRHLDIFRRVLRGEDSSMIYAFHGDTSYDHFHVAICTVNNRTLKRGDWGQGMEVEAAHIALAICEYQDKLTCEPNRRYVADETGVYHTWSGIRVAEPTGDVVKRGVFKAVQAEQVEFDEEIEPPEGYSEGEALPGPTAIKLLARGVIREAKSWDDLHRGLARVGIQYEPYIVKGKVAGGNLVINGAKDKSDDRLSASTLNAGYKRLCDRFGDQSYQPPAPDLVVRPFVYPEYRGKSISEDMLDEHEIEQKRNQQRAARVEFEQFEAREREAMERAIEQVRASAAERKRLKKGERVRHHNKCQKKAKAIRAETEEILKGLRLAFERDEKGRRRGRPSKTKLVHGAIASGQSSSEHPEASSASSWSDHYEIKSHDRTIEYWRDARLAFVERSNLIAVHRDDRQSKIDALLRAQQKFGTVKVIGPPEFRREMLLLAAQMRIPVDRDQAAEAKRLFSELVSRARQGAAKAPIVFAFDAAHVGFERKADGRPHQSSAVQDRSNEALKEAIDRLDEAMQDYRVIVQKRDDGTCAVPREMVGHQRIVNNLNEKVIQEWLRGRHQRQKPAIQEIAFDMVWGDLMFEKSASGIKVTKGDDPEVYENYRKWAEKSIIRDNLRLILEVREKRDRLEETDRLSKRLVDALMGSRSAWEELVQRYGIKGQISGSDELTKSAAFEAAEASAPTNKAADRKPAQMRPAPSNAIDPDPNAQQVRRHPADRSGRQGPPDTSRGPDPWER